MKGEKSCEQQLIEKVVEKRRNTFTTGNETGKRGRTSSNIISPRDQGVAKREITTAKIVMYLEVTNNITYPEVKTCFNENTNECIG